MTTTPDDPAAIEADETYRALYGPRPTTPPDPEAEAIYSAVYPTDPAA